MLATQPLSGRRILVVEDEYFLADDLCRAIQGAGGDVEGPYTSVEQAMAVFRGRACDLAVLDVAVADGVSYPLAEALQWHDVPFIFVTAYEQDGLPDRLKRIYVRHKPCQASDVVSDLVHALRNWQNAGAEEPA